MKQIFNFKPLDIIPFQKGFIIVKIDGKDSKGHLKIGFYTFDIATNTINHSTKSVYLLNKFGHSFSPIVDTIGDYISCSCGILPNKNVHIIYPTGEMGTFNNDGTLIWTGDLLYHDCPIRSLAVDDKYVWCTVPNYNSIIRYSPSLKKVDFRIGGKDSQVFGKPMSISKYNNDLYICNKNSMNITKVNLENFIVSKYKSFEEPVLRYLYIQDKEFVVLSSGIYLL